MPLAIVAQLLFSTDFLSFALAAVPTAAKRNRLRLTRANVDIGCRRRRREDGTARQSGSHLAMGPPQSTGSSSVSSFSSVCWDEAVFAEGFVLIRRCRFCWLLVLLPPLLLLQLLMLLLVLPLGLLPPVPLQAKSKVVICPWAVIKGRRAVRTDQCNRGYARSCWSISSFFLFCFCNI